MKMSRKVIVLKFIPKKRIWCPTSNFAFSTHPALQVQHNITRPHASSCNYKPTFQIFSQVSLQPRDSGPSRKSRRTPERDTIPCVGIGRPASVPAFRLGRLGTSSVPSVGTEQDGDAFRSMKKLGLSRPTEFKTLLQPMLTWPKTQHKFRGLTPWRQKTEKKTSRRMKDHTPKQFPQHNTIWLRLWLNGANERHFHRCLTIALI